MIENAKLLKDVRFTFFRKLCISNNPLFTRILLTFSNAFVRDYLSASSIKYAITNSRAQSFPLKRDVSVDVWLTDVIGRFIGNFLRAASW